MYDASNFTVAPKQELEPWAKEMLEEQEQAQQAETTPEQKEPGANDVLLFEVPALQAGDAEGLAAIIIAHPDLYEQILATAAGFLGNDTLTRALDLVHGAPRAEAQAEPKQEEATPPEVVAQQAAEETTQGTAEASPEATVQHQAEEQAPAAEPEPEPGWVVRARAFNANHQDDVFTFFHATGFACAGPDGEPDPYAVANWQAEHGVAPDGRIGKETAEAAWALMPVEAPAPAQQAPEEPPPQE